MPFDRADLDKSFADATSNAASSEDAVNGGIGIFSHLAYELRVNASNPLAVRAIADLLDERKTELAQAVVTNTPHDPAGDEDEPIDGDFDQVDKPALLTHGQGTAAEPGEADDLGRGTVEQPTAETPSYAPEHPGVIATTGKTDTDVAAEEADEKTALS